MEILELDGIELAIERRGPDGAPVLLLIAGGAQSMDWWTPEFCDLLGAGALQVIRYDHRDTGRSTTSPPGLPDYTGDDLAADPLRLLDALGIDKAHLIGMSMGGGIAQSIAVRAPDRVQSLTLVETSPEGGDPGDLPPPSPAVAATFQEPEPDIDWADETAVIDYRVEVERPYAGPLGLDEARTRALATLEVRRSRNMASSMANHFIATPGTPVDPAEIRVPTLILHSADDPMFPLPHGEALARMIPGARLVRLEGVGHEIPPPAVWDAVIPELHKHLQPVTDERPTRFDEARELAIRAFQGEILGIALFGDLADAVNDEARREEFAVLRRLEERTAETLRGLLRDLGVTPVPDPDFEHLGHDFARWAASVGEAEYLARSEPTIASAMRAFVRLRSLVDPGHVPIVDEVIAHEEALRSYTEARIAGEPDSARSARHHLERFARDTSDLPDTGGGIAQRPPHGAAPRHSGPPEAR